MLPLSCALCLRPCYHHSEAEPRETGKRGSGPGPSPHSSRSAPCCWSVSYWLWIARNTRPDIAHTVNALARVAHNPAPERCVRAGFWCHRQATCSSQLQAPCFSPTRTASSLEPQRLFFGCGGMLRRASTDISYPDMLRQVHPDLGPPGPGPCTCDLLLGLSLYIKKPLPRTPS